MSQWGTRDTKTVTGTISVTQSSRTVTGVGTLFTTELRPGQTLLISSVEYHIAAIASNTSLTLRIPYVATTTSGLTVTANEQPAYISQQGPNGTIATSDMPTTFGISRDEATQTQNRAKGIHTPGWVNYRTYTDAQGTTRNKSHVLIAFGGTGITGDADGATFPDVPVITISAQPASASRVAPTAASFSVTASATNGGVLSYQWQKQESTDTTTWTNISGATSSTFTTGATSIAADPSINSANNGDKYRVVVSATLGAVSVTSNVATLTVT
jgi:hypothetical protein